jgi:hypothetical protein
MTWGVHSLYTSDFDNLGPIGCADVIQSEEARKAQEWAGDYVSIRGISLQDRRRFSYPRALVEQTADGFQIRRDDQTPDNAVQISDKSAYELIQWLQYALEQRK